jgi:hypothetical protein
MGWDYGPRSRLEWRIFIDRRDDNKPYRERAQQRSSGPTGAGKQMEQHQELFALWIPLLIFLKLIFGFSSSWFGTLAPGPYVGPQNSIDGWDDNKSYQ